MFGMVKRVYPFDLSVYNLNPIEYMINTIYRLHIEDGRIAFAGDGFDGDADGSEIVRELVAVDLEVNEVA